MTKIQDLKKMSAKTIMAEVKGIKKAAEGLLFTVMGKVANYKPVEGVPIEYTGFKGKFQAVRAVDGKEFESNTLFLPSETEQILINALMARKSNKKGLLFSFEISKKETKDNAYGYHYETKVILLPESEIDPIEEVKIKIAEQKEKELLDAKANKNKKGGDKTK